MRIEGRQDVAVRERLSAQGLSDLPRLLRERCESRRMCGSAETTMTGPTVSNPIMRRSHDMDCSRRSLLGWLLVSFAGVLTLVAREEVAAQAGAQRQAPETRKVQVDGRATYTDVNAAGLAAMLERKDFPLINVHIPYEGEIEATDQFIPFDQVEANLAKLPADRAARVVLYCRSGSMSVTAARALVKRGYTNVWNLEGGMIAWEQAGYRLLRRGR